MISASTESRGGPAAVAKELRNARKLAFAAAGTRWHATMLPGHFTTRGEALYKMQPRKRRYSIRKAKQYGHRNPLEFTGDMRRMILRAVRVSSTSTGASVVLLGPRYLYAYRKDHDAPDKAAELTATTAREVLDLSDMLDKRITRQLNRVTTRQIRRPRP